MKPFFRIIRQNAFYGKNLPLKVFVDNVCIGEVHYNDYNDFEVNEGIHEMYVKMDDLRSKSYCLHTFEDERIGMAMHAYEVTFPKVSLGINFFELIRQSFIDNNSALVLRKVFDSQVKKC